MRQARDYPKSFGKPMKNFKPVEIEKVDCAV